MTTLLPFPDRQLAPLNRQASSLLHPWRCHSKGVARKDAREREKKRGAAVRDRPVPLMTGVFSPGSISDISLLGSLHRQPAERTCCPRRSGCRCCRLWPHTSQPCCILLRTSKLGQPYGCMAESLLNDFFARTTLRGILLQATHSHRVTAPSAAYPVGPVLVSDARGTRRVGWSARAHALLGGSPLASRQLCSQSPSIAQAPGRCLIPTLSTNRPSLAHGCFAYYTVLHIASVTRPPRHCYFRPPYYYAILHAHSFWYSSLPSSFFASATLRTALLKSSWLMESR